jgi:hypothetical protein
MEPLIVVNGFCFCEKHGDEHCYLCTTDRRFTNNYQIEHRLPEQLDYDIDVFISFPNTPESER